MECLSQQAWSAESIDEVVRRTTAICIVVHIRYKDAFGVFHDEDAAWFINAEGSMLQKLVSDYPANDLKISFSRIDGYGRST